MRWIVRYSAYAGRMKERTVTVEAPTQQEALDAARRTAGVSWRGCLGVTPITPPSTEPKTG
jgi:hypothetical protein